MPARIETVDAGRGYSSDRGTWTFRSGTGQYAGFSGGGAVAAVGLPNGVVISRHEGYLTKR